jgi:hypothetical protein
LAESARALSGWFERIGDGHVGVLGHFGVHSDACLAVVR